MILTPLHGDGLRYSGDKTPSEKPRVPLDVSSWIITGDGVTSCQLIESPAGISVTITEGDTSSPNLTISGGTHGQRYELPVLVTTNNGLKVQITIYVDVKDHVWVNV